VQQDLRDPSRPFDATYDFTYSVAGFRVCTNRTIPQLERSTCEDMCVTVAFGNLACDRQGFPGGAQHAVDQHHWHVLPGTPFPRAFVCDSGQVCWVSESGSAPIDYAVQIRRVLPFASALQGRVVLHASAIRYRANVFAFIGGSGSGKSTLAKLFNAEGIDTVSDDLLPCVTSDDRVSVAVPFGDSRLPSSLPLNAIYFLNRDASLLEPSCIPLTRRQSLQELLKNGFGELPLARVWATQFGVYHRIALQARAFRLNLPNSLTKLAESTRRLVAKDFFLDDCWPDGKTLPWEQSTLRSNS